MSKTTPEQNKALLVEGFEHAFQQAGLRRSRAILVAEIHPAQLTYRTGKRWIV
jgi:hypothetical protein